MADGKRIGSPSVAGDLGMPALGVDGDGNYQAQSVNSSGQSVVAPAVPSTFVCGRKTIAAAGTEEALGATQALTQGVWIKALPTNTGLAYVGKNPVTSGTGYPLAAGEQVFVPTDDIADVFIDVATNGEGVAYLGA